MQKRILIVDDDVEILESMKRKVERGGYKAFTASSAQAGLGILAEEEVDLVMTDIVMSPMDGFTFCRQLKSVPKTEKLPVIVLSAHVDRTEVFKESNVKEFLSKPFDAQTLMDTIAKVLQQTPRYKSILFHIPEEDAAPLRTMLETLRANLDFKMVHNAFDAVNEVLRMRPALLIINAENEEFPVEKLIKSLRGYVVLRDMPIFFYIKSLGKKAKDIQRIQDICYQAGADRCLDELSAATLLPMLFDL
jgi:CheY-like chemotaxis protein